MVKLAELILLAQGGSRPACTACWRTPPPGRSRAVGLALEFATRRARSLAAAHAAELRERDQARAARAAGAPGRGRGCRGPGRAGDGPRAGDSRPHRDLPPAARVTLASGGPARWGVAACSPRAAAAGLICYAFAPRLLRQAVACVSGRWRTSRVFARPGWRPPRRRRRAVLLIRTAGPALPHSPPRPGPVLGPCAAAGSCCWRGAPRGQGGGQRGGTPPPGPVVAATTGTALLVWPGGTSLAAGPAAGLLFPSPPGPGFRAWRAMDNSGRVTVRAAPTSPCRCCSGRPGALRGLARNLLGLSRAEVAAVRARSTGPAGLADLPWWLGRPVRGARRGGPWLSRSGQPGCAGPSGCRPVAGGIRSRRGRRVLTA